MNGSCRPRQKPNEVISPIFIIQKLQSWFDFFHNWLRTVAKIFVGWRREQFSSIPSVKLAIFGDCRFYQRYENTKTKIILGRRPSILNMGQGILQDSPTSPDSGISSGSSLEDLNSAKKDVNTGSPKEKVHFTFPRPAESNPGIPYPPTMVRPSRMASPQSNASAGNTASMRWEPDVL